MFKEYFDKKYTEAVLKSMTDFVAEHLKPGEICFRSGYMETRDQRLLNYLKNHPKGLFFDYRGCFCQGHLSDKENKIMIEFDIYPQK